MLLRAIAIADRKGLLLHELLSRLAAITAEYGPRAAAWELALWAAVMDEEAAYQKEMADRHKHK